MRKTIFGAMVAAFVACAIVSCSNDNKAVEETPEYDAVEVDVESASVDTLVNNGDTTIQAQTVDQVTPETVVE